MILEDTPTLLRDTVDGAHRVKRIIAGVLGFALPAHAEIVPGDVGSDLHTAIIEHKQSTSSNCEIIEEIGELPQLSYDATLIGHVFDNILTNAAQAIPEGRNGRIVVRAKCLGSSVIMEFSDNGIGIPKENLSLIYNPFFTTKEVGIGAGLGLSIAYGIIKDHGWDIAVTSEVGVGTTFAIAAPVGRSVS